MFYLPYKFKSQDEPTTPKGPNFSRAPVVKTIIDGTKISLKLPRHKTIREVGYVSPKSAITLSESNFEYVDKKKYGWKVNRFISRIWDFNGPNFIGRVGDLSLVGFVLTSSSQKKETSNFHPNFFESVISNYLLDFYCKHEDRYELDEPYRWMYQAPVNWVAIDVGDNLQAAKFDVFNQHDSTTGEMETFVFIPVSDNHAIVYILKSIRKTNFRNDIPIDEWINPQPFIELREQIISSITIELSEDAKKQRELALRGVANPKLSETFAPIDWPKDGVLKEKFDIENDDGWGEYS